MKDKFSLQEINEYAEEVGRLFALTRISIEYLKTTLVKMYIA